MTLFWKIFLLYFVLLLVVFGIFFYNSTFSNRGYNYISAKEEMRTWVGFFILTFSWSAISALIIGFLYKFGRIKIIKFLFIILNITAVSFLLGGSLMSGGQNAGILFIEAIIILVLADFILYRTNRFLLKGC